jgi:hypothetical protein
VPTHWAAAVIVVMAAFTLVLPGCASYEKREMIVTAYSSDKISTNWKRGKVLFWRKYVASGRMSATIPTARR